MIKHFRLAAKKRKALEAMRRIVLPFVATLQKPGHSIPLDVLVDPFVLGFISSYSKIAVGESTDDCVDKQKEIWVATIEQFLAEIAKTKAAGREMALALVKYSESGNADYVRGEDLAIKHWSVFSGSKEFDDDPVAVQAFQQANAMINARTSVLGSDDDTPRHAATRFLHAQLLHHVSSKYGVEDPGWRQWLRGW